MLTCGTVKTGPNAGAFVADELVEEQTLDNLFAFGRRLAEAHRTRMPKRSSFDAEVAEALGPRL